MAMSTPPSDPRSIHVEAPAMQEPSEPVDGIHVEVPDRARRWPWVLLALAFLIGLPLGVIGVSSWSAPTVGKE